MLHSFLPPVLGGMEGMEGERLCCVAVWRVLWFTFSITHMWKPNNGLSHLHPQHIPTQELEYKDGILVAGSLNALIDLLIPTETHYPEVRPLPAAAALSYAQLQHAAFKVTATPLLCG